MKHAPVNRYYLALLSLILLISPLSLSATKKNNETIAEVVQHDENTDSETTKSHHLSQAQKDILEADALWVANFGDKGDLTEFSSKKIAILTCMDPRIDADQIFGLNPGDAYVIRNAGGRASDDAIRSLVVSSKLLDTKEWFVVQHTDCGMAKFTDVIMRNLMWGSLGLAKQNSHGHWYNTKKGPGSTEAFFINWLTINHGLRKSVIMDVTRIRNHPLVSGKIKIYGYIYDVDTGELIPVPKAMKIGMPKD